MLHFLLKNIHNVNTNFFTHAEKLEKHFFIIIPGSSNTSSCFKKYVLVSSMPCNLIFSGGRFVCMPVFSV